MPEPNGGSPDATAPAYLPFGAYAPPSALRPAPPPTWASTYELPSARRVVSAGLQLSLSATSEIRRGSIYIGLLMLAALLPVLAIVVASLLGIAPAADRLFGLVLLDPSYLMLIDRNLAGLALVIDAAILLFAILLIAISIDAQAISIALLAGRATGRPLRLWEAVARARRVFWRLARASFVVGLPAVVIAFVIGQLLNGRNQSPEAADLVSQIVTTLLLAPFAYISTGIVIGDVGVLEAARRSIRLFRARPRTGLVVVLFPLITAAIQVFALASGVDLVGRVVEFLHLDALTGGAGAVVGITLVVVAIVALGSLIFTISAIVAAPQVAAFLGLTLYAGGVDQARIDGPQPAGLRWVTRPMAATIGVAVPLILVAVVNFGSAIRELPDFGAFPGGGVTGRGDDLWALLNEVGDEHGEYPVFSDIPFYLEDNPGDAAGVPNSSIDIVYVELGMIEVVPDWFLTDVFHCGLSDVVCNVMLPPPTAYAEGALIVLVKTAAAPLLLDGLGGEWGAVFWLSSETPSPFDADDPLSGASHAVVTRSGDLAHIGSQAFRDGEVRENDTYARTLWLDDGLVTMIPNAGELERRPLFWDVYALVRDESGAAVGRDSMRTTTDGRGLRAWSPPPMIGFVRY